jgi:2-succinyl-5-enolpyruvyl-6-hydroxy-3-cyclohexene-1-carboxylate synthase
VSRLCAAAIGEGQDAGPVHLNVPLREPLVPGVDPVSWLESLDGRSDGGPWVKVRHFLPQVEGLDYVPKTLVLLGDLPGPSMAVMVTALAHAAGWPVIAEPFGA